MLASELEADRAAEVDELRLAEQRMQSRPEADVPGLDHALLPKGQGDERAELNDLRSTEMLAQRRPHRVVGALGMPDQHARVQERGLLARREAVRRLELQQIGVVILGETLVPPTEGALRASVLALDRLRDVHAAELLHRMLENSLPEDALLGARVSLRHGRHVRPDRLPFRE